MQYNPKQGVANEHWTNGRTVISRGKRSLNQEAAATYSFPATASWCPLFQWVLNPIFIFLNPQFKQYQILWMTKTNCVSSLYAYVYLSHQGQPCVVQYIPSLKVRLNCHFVLIGYCLYLSSDWAPTLSLHHYLSIQATQPSNPISQTNDLKPVAFLIPLANHLVWPQSMVINNISSH